MTKKQKKTLVRIVVSAVLFAVLLALRAFGVTDSLPGWAVFALWLVPYAVIGWDVVYAAFRNIIRGNVFDEHFLMTVATFAAFALGIFGEGEYPEAVAVMLFYQVGEFFQSLAVGRSRRSVASLMELAPDVCFIETEDGVAERDPDEAAVGDIMVIRPGEKIPLDGEVIEGESFIDTSALTGESVPRRAAPGDALVSGCVNGSGLLRARITKEYENSTVARILDLVENAGSRKAKIENFITRFSRVYTPAVTVCAVLLALVTPLLGGTVGEGVRRACGFLIVSCPCALVISVPLGFFGGIGAASRAGVLIKGSNFMEAAAGIDTVLFDKTGTLTKGEFAVRTIDPAPESGLEKDDLLGIVAAAEARSTHPIAASILAAYGKAPDAAKIGDLSEIPGKGISASYGGKKLLVGNAALLAESGLAAPEAPEDGTAVFAALDGKYLGCIVISDSVREEAAGAIGELRALGVKKTVMLTGDNARSARAAADAAGIDEYRAGLLPADKVAQAESLSKASPGRIGFVGDGVNDAPVLVISDVGFAMGSMGSDAAIEAADIVIMNDDLKKLPFAIRLSKRTVGIVRANVIFALAVKGVILVLSALGAASMWAAVFGDVGVAMLCILNSLRLIISGDRAKI
ncbi:MAG: cadmium-translocating P-type ATPase [Clostridia bacterium]|nr:cadmium-translocating P-type ATPase [Clostridia bacterium]